MSSDCVVIVHAGVGRRSARSSSLVANLCELAARKGRQLGRSSGDPTAAVVEAIRILENSPLTNAGIGSNVNRDGEVECDASLVEGWSQNGGTVAAVPSAANAILIAQMLAQKNGPACLAGPGALRWFRENGGEMPDRSKDLVTSYQRKMFRQYSTAGSSAASRRVDTGGGGFGGHHSGCRSAAAAVVSGATPSAAAGCCGVRGGGAASAAASAAAAAEGDDTLMLSEGETRCVVAAAAALAEAAGDFAGPVDTDFATTAATTTTTTIADDDDGDDGGGGGNGGDVAAVPGARNEDDDGGDDCVDDGEDERGGREDEEHNRVDDDDDDDDNDDDDDDDGDDDDDLRRRLDTVGAVALVGGRIAAGVSSGGIFLKPPGRVGQAGVYGAGCYADRSAGVSTSGTGDHLIRTLLATKCVNALTNAIQPDPPSMGDDDDEPDGMKPPAMILKTVLEEKFVNAPVVRNSQGPQIAAGVVGVVYDDKSGLCDLVWGHTSGNFIVAYAAPGTAKRNEVRSEICSQRDIDDIEEMKVYASGTVIRLR